MYDFRPPRPKGHTSPTLPLWDGSPPQAAPESDGGRQLNLTAGFSTENENRSAVSSDNAAAELWIGTVHKPYESLRRRIHASFIRTYQPLTTLSAHRTCMQRSVILVSRDGATKAKRVPIGCGHRLCPLCSRRRAARIAGRLAEQLPSHPTRLITLTLRSSDAYLGLQIDELWRAFDALRRTKQWKSRVFGYVGVVEVTWSPERRQWHPHIHVVCEGKYFDQRELSELWMAASRGSSIVHVSLIRRKEAAAQYVAKYVSKPWSNQASLDDRVLDELVESMAKRKLIMAGGRWRKWKLLSEPADSEYELLCYEDELDALVEQGDEMAIAVRNAMAFEPERDEWEIACTDTS